jgi:hypothetical protein
MFKLKVHFSCVAFIKHYAVKMCGRVRCIDLCVLLLSLDGGSGHLHSSGLDDVEKRKITCPCRQSDSLAIQPVIILTGLSVLHLRHNII